MKLFEKFKNWVNKILNRDKYESDFLLEQGTVKQLPEQEDEQIELQTGELVQFSEKILDTTSKVTVEKFKHNLEILIKRAKETGKIDKFKIIREDDFFPDNWEWRVLSKNTNLEKECIALSYELKKSYALEQNGINPYNEINGIKIPLASYEEEMQAISNVDKTYGSVLLPSRFRSTKHFTVNTPLAVTGDYNNVDTNRDYIIIDDISLFLKSEYGYSVSYHDAYLDVAHEGLTISQEAVVLINDNNYDRIMSDEKRASELSQRRVVRFKGDEITAINMILTEMGVLPSKVGSIYADYDDEIYDILDSSIKNLARENGLFFDKSHGGKLKPNGGHFSSYYDEKNNDYEKALDEFSSFLRKKFSEHPELFPKDLRFTEESSSEIVKKLGVTNLSEAINEYNELASVKGVKTLEDYKKDRQNITPEIHKQFVDTVSLLNSFYKTEINYQSNEERIQIEEAIRRFM